MEYFLVRYDSRVVNYEREMLIRLTTVLIAPSFGNNNAISIIILVSKLDGGNG